MVLNVQFKSKNFFLMKWFKFHLGFFSLPNNSVWVAKVFLGKNSKSSLHEATVIEIEEIAEVIDIEMIVEAGAEAMTVDPAMEETEIDLRAVSIADKKDTLLVIAPSVIFKYM